MGELRWWSAVRSYPHPESRAENGAGYVSEVVSGGRVREQVWSRKDWVVVWSLLRRVVTSKPPPCSHRHCHKQTGRRFVCCAWHVQISRASKQVKYSYSGYELTTYIAGKDMRCLHGFVASSQW